MRSLDNAERPQLGNHLSFGALAGIHGVLASYPYSYKLNFDNHMLQPYVAATVRMHSDAVFSSIGASPMKTLIKN